MNYLVYQLQLINVLKSIDNSLRMRAPIGAPTDMHQELPEDNKTDDNADASPKIDSKDLIKLYTVKSIDQMSLSFRQHTTCGLIYPPPLTLRVYGYEVKQGDTWFDIAKRFDPSGSRNVKPFLELLLRVNEVPSEMTLDILHGRRQVESIPLTPGQFIYIPVDEI